MPDIIQQIRDTYAENPAAALKLLSELFKAANEGKIVELPCKVGDILYRTFPYFHPSTVDQCEVEHITVSDGNVVVQCYIDPDGHIEFELGEFGKTVFFTREAAEKALKEREA